MQQLWRRGNKKKTPHNKAPKYKLFSPKQFWGIFFFLKALKRGIEVFHNFIRRHDTILFSNIVHQILGKIWRNKKLLVILEANFHCSVALDIFSGHCVPRKQA
jgi:hypothetical protein